MMKIITTETIQATTLRTFTRDGFTLLTCVEVFHL